MKLFLNYILFLTPLLTLSCSASEIGSNMNGGSSTRSERNTYYATDEEGDDFAQIPAAVAGGFQLLDCNYKQPSVSDSSADIGCAAKDEYGEKADMTDLVEAKLKVSKHQNLSSDVSDCDDSDSCHWKIHVTRTNPDVKISSELKKMNFMLRARTSRGEEISIASETEILPMDSVKRNSLNIIGNDMNIYLGEKGGSCTETCESVGKVFDPEKQREYHTKDRCEKNMKTLGPSGKLYKKVYEERWDLHKFGRIYKHYHKLSLGCIAIFDPPNDGQGTDHLSYEYYFQRTQLGGPDDRKDRVRRYCSCK